MSNRAAQQLGRLGGLAKSEAKAAANREKALRFWADVRAGKRPAPRRRKKADGHNAALTGGEAVPSNGVVGGKDRP